MYKKKQFYCVHPQWMEGVAEQLGGKLLDNIITLPDTLGKGQAFFTLVTPGISVLLIDCELHKQLELKRPRDDTKRYILHFDISDNVNSIKIHNEEHNVGVTINQGLAIFSNQNISFLKPTPSGRTFVLRVFVDKDLMEELIENYSGHEFISQKINFSKKHFFHADNIDSNSLLFLLSLKENSIYEAAFTANIKGIALKLLSNTINRYNEPTVKGITKSEEEEIVKIKNYLLENLHNPFPSIKFLSEMAGMSGTKFKILFKKRFRTTTKKIFTQEKLILANQLLKSGDYNSLTEVIQDLNYSNLDHFSLKYSIFFQRKPVDDFVKKQNRKND